MADPGKYALDRNPRLARDSSKIAGAWKEKLDMLTKLARSKLLKTFPVTLLFNRCTERKSHRGTTTPKSGRDDQTWIILPSEVISDGYELSIPSQV
jgi:hypothetical protein